MKLVEKLVNELRAVIGPLSGQSLIFCNGVCLRRYLRARNWSTDKSKKMLEETLKWRATYKPEEICWHEVDVEGETGKVYRANFHDHDGRTILVLRPGKQIVKYFLDPKTCQKVKFVYPKNEESTSLMHKNFDLEVLPEEFGGKSKVQYNHEEFSKLMRKDDIKTAVV
ncbi:hypothetical protein Cni_G19699 [Canna indica]|uniref:CRAL/TRIO N-terminal domain-containing protein n=1 Tax=Canna indica TaxID=4628 RepID=A0AAQ3KMK9_9LILI|nr:hypothetical protein Cni_G19699 [Canna indica]